MKKNIKFTTFITERFCDFQFFVDLNEDSNLQVLLTRASSKLKQEQITVVLVLTILYLIL